jgi:hypothetical protein
MFNDRAQVFESENSKTVIFGSKSPPRRAAKPSSSGTSPLRQPTAAPQQRPQPQPQPQPAAPKGHGSGLLGRLFQKGGHGAKKTEERPVQGSPQRAEVSAAEIQRRLQPSPAQKFNGRLREFMDSDMDRDTKRKLGDLLAAEKYKEFLTELGQASKSAPNTKVFGLMQSMARAMQAMDGDYSDITVYIPK